MALQTAFWLKGRDSDGDGLPEYAHGCDSGWDNGTGFEGCTPCASPDLAAWLVLQLEELARMAPRIGLEHEAPGWTDAARRVAEAAVHRCFDGARWTAVRAGDHRPSPVGDSLLPWLAGIAGHRFPRAARQAVVAALSEHGRFLTPFGVATEAVTSPLYEADGYWRGPVWGPSTVLAAEAAARCGAPGLAASIARRFAGIAPRFGFAENHDALTGQGLRDPAYSWTAAAWITLHHDWLTPTG